MNNDKSDLNQIIESSNKINDFLSKTGGTANLNASIDVSKINKKNVNIYYKNNKNLRKAGVEVPLSEYQLEEVYKCHDNIIYMTGYMKILTATKGIMDLILRPFQVELLSAFTSHNRVVINASRQIGKTTITSIYVIHYAMFNDHKNVWILANKGKTAKKILRNIRTVYESLPIWMQVGIVNWTSEMVEFENGTIINVGTTTSESARSEGISLLILDEFGRIAPHIEDDFVTSVFPTVSSSPDTQIIIISTPKGISNTFYRICRDAKKRPDPNSMVGTNGYMYFEYDWTVVPERIGDPKWKIQALADLKGDERKFAQEYCCSFLGSVNTMIDQKKIESMIPASQINGDEFELRIYDNPKKSHKYALIVDIAKGVGRTASTIQVFDITVLPFNQVLTYENKNIGTFEFSRTASDIAKQYNNAYMFIENNGIGESVCVTVMHSFEYDNVYINSSRRGEIGICTSVITKDIGATEIGVLMDKNMLNIVDDRTIGQISTFVNDNGYWKPDKDSYSDLIMPVVHFGYIINTRSIRVDYLGLPDDFYSGWVVEEQDIDEESDESDSLLSDFDNMTYGLPIMVVGNEIKFASDNGKVGTAKSRNIGRLNKRLDCIEAMKENNADKEKDGEDDEEDLDLDLNGDHIIVI